jgi:hypothetical protein
MATTDMPLRDRLEAAMIEMSPLRADNFPEGELRRRYQGIREDLTIEEARVPGEGRIRSTLRILTDEDAAAIAGRIFDLFLDLRRLTRSDEPHS